METVLAGDIGGTHTRLAVFAAGDLRKPLVRRSYPSGDFESLQAIIGRFVDEVGGALPALPGRAGFGVAGPADGVVVKLTNLPWVVDARRIEERLDGARVRLVNDFTAVCLAVPRLTAEDVHRIGGHDPAAKGAIAVLGAGTGLGQGFLVWRGTDYMAVPSEGGHADFAPRNPLEIRCLEFLTTRFGRVSWERVVSGPGLVNIYEFLRDGEGMPESADVHREMQRDDAPAVVSRHGLKGSDALCERALDLFCAGYGSEAGNLALKILARGGVYLAGGIARQIIPKLEAGGFRHAFESKGRYSSFLETVPVFVITHPDAGLMGAAIAGLEA